MPATIDLAGQSFGWLTVVRRCGRNKRGAATWLCVCGCGQSTEVAGTLLRRELTTSCGCRRSRAWFENQRRVRNRYGASHISAREDYEDAEVVF